MGIETAILGSAVLGGLAANKAAKTQASAATSAADAQLQATREANALQQRIYEESIKRQQPFLDVGTTALNRLVALNQPGADTSQFLQMDPGYGFRLAEGQKALERSAAARGGLISGAALKAAQRYGQEMGSQEYGAAYNRLANLANLGPSAAGVMSNLGQTYGSQAGQNLMAGGQAVGQGLTNAAAARASGYMGGVNALTGGLGQYLNYSQNQALMNRLFSQPGMQFTNESGFVNTPAYMVQPGP